MTQAVVAIQVRWPFDNSGLEPEPGSKGAGRNPWLGGIGHHQENVVNKGQSLRAQVFQVGSRRNSNPRIAKFLKGQKVVLPIRDEQGTSFTPVYLLCVKDLEFV